MFEMGKKYVFDKHLLEKDMAKIAPKGEYNLDDNEWAGEIHGLEFVAQESGIYVKSGSYIVHHDWCREVTA